MMNPPQDKTVIGKDCKIEGKLISKGRITIGDNVTIKQGAVVNAFAGITILDNALIDRNVIIGGLQSDRSTFHMGKDSVILHGTYINPVRPIVIGDGVGIGGHCRIFTHGAWQNIFEGYPSKFGSVIIKNNVWIPWNVTILPSVVIGENTVIGTGSTVSKSIPKDVYAAGNPAKVIWERKKLTDDEKHLKLNSIIHFFMNYCKDFLHVNFVQLTYNELTLDDEILVFVPRENQVKKISKLKEPIVIDFKVTDQDRGAHWIELDTLTTNTHNKYAQMFIQFIKRYGVRIK